MLPIKTNIPFKSAEENQEQQKIDKIKQHSRSAQAVSCGAVLSNMGQNPVNVAVGAGAESAGQGRA